MNDDFTKYEAMPSSGALPESVYRAAMQDGLDAISRIRFIRAVYGLSPGQAKEVVIRAEGYAATMDEHQGRIAENLQS